MFDFFRRVMLRNRSRKGQTTAEYAIIVALVAIASITVIMVFGDQLRQLIAGETKQLAGDQGAGVIDETDRLDDDAVKGTLDTF